MIILILGQTFATQVAYVIQQDPILAFWPLLLLAIGALATTTVCIAIATDTSEVDGDTMCVLGMQEAGKTKLFMNLQGKTYNEYVASNKEDIPPFNFTYKDRSIKVKKCIDINGTALNVKPYYESLIMNNDIIFFLFNVKKYLEDRNYASEVRARLEMIWRKYESKEQSKSHVVTLATHVDLLSDTEKNNVIKKLQDSVSGRPYYHLFHHNLLAVDLTSKDFMKELEKNNIFG